MSENKKYLKDRNQAVMPENKGLIHDRMNNDEKEEQHPGGLSSTSLFRVPETEEGRPSALRSQRRGSVCPAGSVTVSSRCLHFWGSFYFPVVHTSLC